MKKADIKKLDKIWADKVKEIGHCESCLESGDFIKLEAAHIVGRSYRTTRWGAWINGEYDLNGMCLCFSCHQAFDQHMKMEKFIREVVIGLERYNCLLTTKKLIAKNQNVDEIKEWIAAK